MKKLKGIWSAATKGLRWIGSRFYHLPFLHPVLSVTGKTGKAFARDDCHIWAAAISFYAILSLIPFLLLLLSTAGFILKGFDQQFASQEELFSHISTYVRAVFPFLEDEFMARLEGIVSNRGAYGITGLAILFITAGLVFRTLEHAFGRVFEAKRRRSLVVSQLLFVVFFLSVGLLFLAVHYLGVLSSTFYSARDAHFSQRWDQFLTDHALLRFAVNLLTTTTVFVFLLKYFSRERVRLKFALAGGLLFSQLWLLAIHVFGYYLTTVARFSLLYGSLATLAIIVVWIFYSSSILLLCAEFTWVLENRSNTEVAGQSGK